MWDIPVSGIIMSRSLCLIILCEIQLLLSLMRQNKRWRTSSDPSAPPLVHSLDQLRIWLNEHLENMQIDLVRIVQPFAAVISSHETSGVITGAALTSLLRIVQHGLFEREEDGAIEAVAELAEAVCHCQFEATSSAFDEVVFHSVLQLVTALLKSKAGAFLPEERLLEMVQLGVRIHLQMRPPQYSILLCEAAMSMLYEMVTCMGIQMTRTKADDPRYLFTVFLFFNIIANRMECHASLKLYPFFVIWQWSHGIYFYFWLCKNSKSHSKVISFPQLILSLSLLHSFVSSLPTDSILKSSIISIVRVLLECSRVSIVVPASINFQPVLLMSMVTRVFHSLFIKYRSMLFVQVELVMNTIFLRLLNTKNLNSDLRELLIESLYDLCTLPNFIRELFINYDCDIRCSNVAANLLQFLSRASFPTLLADNATKQQIVEISSVHFKALKSLLAVGKSLETIIRDDSCIYIYFLCM